MNIKQILKEEIFNIDDIDFAELGIDINDTSSQEWLALQDKEREKEFNNSQEGFFTLVSDKLGINIDARNKFPLGSGAFGIVYLAGDKTVKFTGEKQDAEICHALLLNPLDKYFAKVYSVHQIETTKYKKYDSQYVIVKEYVEPINSAIKEAFDIMHRIRRGYHMWDFMDGEFDGFIDKARRREVPEDMIQWYVGFYQETIKRHMEFNDIRGENIGRRGEREFVVFDMGVSKGGRELKSQHKVQVAEIETLTNDTKEVSNLNQNFKEWFGNSKIVENNLPMVCYHGSPTADIDTFDFKQIGNNSGNSGHYGYGIYFSDDIREAKIYGDSIYECYIKMVNPFTGTNDQILQLKEAGVDNIDDLEDKSIDFDSLKECFKHDKIVYEFLTDFQKIGGEAAWDKMHIRNLDDATKDKLNDITNMMEYTTLNKHADGVPDYIIKDLENLNIQPKINKGFPYAQSLHWITDLGNQSYDVTEVIKSLGYDGVHYGSEIVAFDPRQIKSVKNNGRWDGNNPNIYS